MVVTGNSAYAKYGYATAFGSAGARSNTFGKDVNVNSISLGNSQTPLAQLGSAEIQDFYYGKKVGSCTIDYTLSNPWVFSWIFGNRLGRGNDVEKTGGNPNTYVWNSGKKTAQLGSLEFGIDDSSNIVRVVPSAICRSMSLKASVGDSITVSQQFDWGNEGTPSTSFSASSSEGTTTYVPYEFTHSTFSVGGTAQQKIQSFDLSITPNHELIYGLGRHDSVDAYRKLIDITGKVNVVYENADLLNKVHDAFGTSNSSRYSNISLNMDQGSNRSILLTLSDVGLSQHNTPSIAPGEPIFQEYDFQARTMTVTAKTPDNTLR